MGLQETEKSQDFLGIVLYTYVIINFDYHLGHLGIFTS